MSQMLAGESQWPPRSPHEALLSTPGGRNRLQHLTDRTSPSPSPIKRSRSTPSLQNQARAILRSTTDINSLDDDNEDEDEDEETLQLQLQEIQARLKLKKLQKAKGREVAASDTEKDPIRSGGGLLTRAKSSAAIRLGHDGAESQRHRLETAKASADVHVPASPNRRVQSTEPPRSPGRVLLGIDKGLKGSDISLRRPPTLRHAQPESVADERRPGGYLQRANSQASTYGSIPSRSQSSLDDTKLRTFSERMADVRTQEADRREKDARIKRARSKAFDINAEEMEKFKTTAVTIPDSRPQAPQFSRDQIMDAYNMPAGGLLQRSKSTSVLSPVRVTATALRATVTTSSAASTSQSSSQVRKKPPVREASSEFESFSSLHLSKRIIPHTVLTRTFSGKKTLTIPEVLKTVVAPHFRLPDVEDDIVILAVIASKSEPKRHKAKATNDERGKYMVMTLTDLKWELDMFLFNSGFDKFWKLTPGTVIAILNPSIMAPIKADTGRFSLTLNSSNDTILELGTARDLGFCKAVKNDGKTCDAWIDKRHTEICEFHVNLELGKTKAGRMEINSMNFGKTKKKDIDRYGSSMYGARKHNSREVFARPDPPKDRSNYDRSTKSKFFIGASMKGSAEFIGGPGRSSASLIDDPDVDPDAFHRGSKEERMRRQLAAKEREREIAEKLATVGRGLGADYLRLRDQQNPASSSTIDERPGPLPDVAILGLSGSKVKDVQLSPIKRKRAGTTTPTGSIAIGWGGHLTKELGRMKDGERLQPVKKKTRFVTAKGIREAGRESFGGDVGAATATTDDNDDDDDDDDLDIIR